MSRYIPAKVDFEFGENSNFQLTYIDKRYDKLGYLFAPKIKLVLSSPIFLYV